MLTVPRNRTRVPKIRGEGFYATITRQQAARELRYAREENQK
jgi:hypothetical protein